MGVIYKKTNSKKIANINGRKSNFGKFIGFIEKNVEFVMTTMSHDGSETTSL